LEYDEKDMLRKLKFLKLTLLLLALFAISVERVHASQGTGGGNSGPGSGGSGSGGGGDDDDDDDDDGGNQGPGSYDGEKESIAQAVASGNAVGIKQLLRHVREKYPGTVIYLRLQKSGGRFIYQVKILTKSSRVQKLKLDAKTLQPVR
jgi:hypothetical protein